MTQFSNVWQVDIGLLQTPLSLLVSVRERTPERSRMIVLPVGFASISGVAAVAVFLFTGIAVSWIANPQSLSRRIILASPKSRLDAPGSWRVLAGSLALWAVVCGAAVVVLHTVTSDVGGRVGAYRTGIATLVLFVLAAVIAMRRRIAWAPPEARAHGRSQYQRQHDPATPARNSPPSLSTRQSIKPKTWQRLHIGVAIGAMLPLWWHCDLGRASPADLMLKIMSILLVMGGFCAVAMTDLTRWRLLSPMFSPRLSAVLIKGLFAVHRALALLVFMLIAIHVLVVLYFAGI
jgi:hypothetical protein